MVFVAIAGGAMLISKNNNDLEARVDKFEEEIQMLQATLEYKKDLLRAMELELEPTKDEAIKSFLSGDEEEYKKIELIEQTIGVLEKEIKDIKKLLEMKKNARMRLLPEAVKVIRVRAQKIGKKITEKKRAIEYLKKQQKETENRGLVLQLEKQIELLTKDIEQFEAELGAIGSI